MALDLTGHRSSGGPRVPGQGAESITVEGLLDQLRERELPQAMLRIPRAEADAIVERLDRVLRIYLQHHSRPEQMPATVSGFVPTGPSGPTPFQGKDEGDYTTAELLYGVYDLRDDNDASLIGHLVMIPSTYAVLQGTQYSNRDHFRWKTGESWPSAFRLKPKTSLGSGSGMGSWQGFDHGVFQDESMSKSGSGTLYQIVRTNTTPDEVVGYAHVREDAIQWWALPDQLNSNDLIQMSPSTVLRFVEITTPSHTLTDLYSLLSES